MINEMTKTELSVVRTSLYFYPIKGGSITHILELSERIDPYLKHQMIVAPIVKGDNFGFDKKFSVPISRIGFFDVKTSPLRFLPMKNIINDFLFAKSITKYVRKLIADKYPIDIVHVHADLLGSFVVMFFRIHGIKIPVVFMRHGELIEGKRSFLSNFALFLLNYFKPDHFILLDDGTRIGPYMEELEKKKIPYTIVYHGIDTDLFKPSKNVKTNDEFTLITTYRMVKYKGLDLAISAFKAFADGSNGAKNAKLYIIGDGPERENLERQVKDLGLTGQVIFKGEMGMEEVRSYLVQADVVIGPSIETNMNRSIQEAMACAIPVLVFDSGGTGKIMKNMENGIIVENGNVPGLAAGMTLLYNDPGLRARLGERARQTIIESRNWDSRVRKELGVYQVVLKK